MPVTSLALEASTSRVPLKIVTSCQCPPIPVRTSDWCAHYDGQEEAGNYGWGRTEEEAIADFIENCAEDHDERIRASYGLATRDWNQWIRERREYEEPYAPIGGRY